MLKKFLAVPALAIAFVSTCHAIVFEIDDLTRAGSGITADGTSAAHRPIGGGGGFDSALASGYTQIYLDLEVILGRTVMLNEISSITYTTRQTVADSPLNWALRIYTDKQAGNDGWFRYRLDGINPNSGDTQWTVSDTDVAGLINRYESRIGGTTATGTFSSLTLEDIVAQSRFDTETLQFLSFYVGSSSNTVAISSILSEVTVNFVGGESLNIQLIPEPGTWALLGGAAVGMWVIRSRRRAV